MIVSASQVTPLDRTFGDTVTIHEQMGLGSLAFIKSNTT
jgi:hypothetical protein